MSIFSFYKTRPIPETKLIPAVGATTPFRKGISPNRIPGGLHNKKKEASPLTYKEHSMDKNERYKADVYNMSKKINLAHIRNWILFK